MRMKEAIRLVRWSATGLLVVSTLLPMSMPGCTKLVDVPTGAKRAQVDSLVQAAGGSPQDWYQLDTTRAGQWQVLLPPNSSKRTYVRDWLTGDGWGWGALTTLIFVWPPLLFALQHRFRHRRFSALLRLVFPLAAAFSGFSIFSRTNWVDVPLIGGKLAVAAEITLMLVGLTELGSGLGTWFAARGRTGWVAPARWVLAVVLAAAALLPFGADWFQGSHSGTEFALAVGVHGWALVLCFVGVRPAPSAAIRVLTTLFPLLALVSLVLVLTHTPTLDNAMPGAPFTVLVEGLLLLTGLVGFGLLFPEEAAPAPVRMAAKD